MSDFTQILTSTEVSTILDRMTRDVQSRVQPDQPFAIVGIHTRGVILAQRMCKMFQVAGLTPHFGTIDISLYRDDLDQLPSMPQIHGSSLTFPIDKTHILLVDDVLFTGRTIRAALDVLMDYGRPACIELAVLIDRGNRELPIQAQTIGHTIHTSPTDHIQVRLDETDGNEGVWFRKGVHA